MTREEEVLLEQVTSAHRKRNVDGELKGHPAFYDLDAAGRAEAFEATVRLRTIEAAIDADGFSGTVHAVLARLK